MHELRGIGISPDVLLCRADYPIGADLLDKIALFGSVEREAVIPLQTADYDLPGARDAGAVRSWVTISSAAKAGSIEARPDPVARFRLAASRTPSGEVHIALVGKYVALHDAYKSVHESLVHAAAAHNKRWWWIGSTPEEVEN